MGRGSNDPILNRYMPKTAKLNVPDVLDIVREMPCRNEAELLACKNLSKSCVSLSQETIELLKDIEEAHALIEAKIKAYEEEL